MDKFTDKQLEQDVTYLLARADNAGKSFFGGVRDYGSSSNALVRMAYEGGEAFSPWPSDHADLAACELAVNRLPAHRLTEAVTRELERARERVVAKWGPAQEPRFPQGIPVSDKAALERALRDGNT